MSVFTTCMNGHDLTVEGAYFYTTNGTRECRLCSTRTTKAKGKDR